MLLLQHTNVAIATWIPGSQPESHPSPGGKIATEAGLLTPTIFQIDPERCLINPLKQTKLQ
jgi:hypothetical protein